MAQINVLDLKEMLRSFITNEFRKNHALVDASPESPVANLVINPLVDVFTPFLALVSEVENSNDLTNAGEMPVERLNSIGYGNYFVLRYPGESAEATLTLSFTNLSLDESLTIPLGSEFSTSDGLKYVSIQSHKFTPIEVKSSYNPYYLTYDFDIPVRAVEFGSKYNVGEGQINTISSKFNKNLQVIKNRTPAIGGSDEESNLDYASRIRDSYLARNLGTSMGYKSYLFNEYPEIEDIYVAGYRDKYMVRDVSLIKNPATGRETIEHMGGKVDIYIKGFSYGTRYMNVLLNSNNLKLSQPASTIVMDGSTPKITITNRRDSTKNLTISVSNVVPIDGYFHLTLNNSDNASFDPDYVSEIAVSYSYLQGTDELSQTDVFSVGVNQFEIDSPAKEISYIKVTEDETYVSEVHEKVEIIRGGELGTTGETASMTLSGLDYLPSGSELEIAYTVNETLMYIGKMLADESFRIVTSDVIVKEATPLFINMALNVKMHPGETFSETKKSVISASIYEFFNNLNLGAGVQESDIVGWIYKNPNITKFLDYIDSPFKSFYTTDDPSESLVLGKRDGEIVRYSVVPMSLPEYTTLVGDDLIIVQIHNSKLAEPSVSGDISTYLSWVESPSHAPHPEVTVKLYEGEVLVGTEVLAPGTDKCTFKNVPLVRYSKLVKYRYEVNQVSGYTYQVVGRNIVLTEINHPPVSAVYGTVEVVQVWKLPDKLPPTDLDPTPPDPFIPDTQIKLLEGKKEIEHLKFSQGQFSKVKPGVPILKEGSALSLTEISYPVLNKLVIINE